MVGGERGISHLWATQRFRAGEGRYYTAGEMRAIFSSKLLLSLGPLLFAGCEKEATPRDFKLELTDMIYSPDPVMATVRATSEEGVTAVRMAEAPFTVAPPDLASVTPKGMVSCQQSGDGTLNLTLGANTKKAPLRCRLVEKVDASDTGRVELTAGAFKPKIRVLGKGGVELDGVEPTLSSKNTGVLIARGSELVPKTVGTATLIARAGQATQEFKVDVVRKLTPEALPLNQNRKINFSLDAGKYELRVQLPSPQALKAEWRGAPHCDYTGTSAEHVVTCVLRTKGGVVFDSPAYLLRQSTEISTEGISIFEIP